MGRYQKYHSNYTLRKRHQTINGGVITERDWTTLGERLRFGPNKRTQYADGNFIFTSSNVAPYPKRKKTFINSNAYNYDDVEYSTDEVNNVEPNINTNDIRTFAYYGSCVELVRASIENIIAEFPACITLSTQQLTYYAGDDDGFLPIPIENGGDGSDYYLLSNPFNIDLYHKNVTLGKYDNPYRFLTTSWNEYSINGSPIIEYTISDWLCKDAETKENLDNCNCQYDTFLSPVLRIDITTEDDSIYILYGYLVDNDIVFTCKGDFLLKPNDDIIEDYFDSLKGFEKQLLNRKTDPLYKNSFITPIMGEVNYQYYERPYIWPTMSGTDYCIDIESMSYINFINSLTDLATLMDELWTDNLYRNMTHEAIKNFDWTYTREFEEGEEQDNIDGGERMKKILHIFARLMDDCKRYIDAIKYANKVSYCSYDDMPNAVVSDKLGYQGWDYTSTIPTLTDDDGNVIDISNTVVDEEFLDNSNYVNKIDQYSDVPKWFPATNTDVITPSYTDIDFSRRLLLSSAYIWRAKGTQHSIEMVMGMFGFGLDIDYSLTEKYYTVTPIGADTDITITAEGDKESGIGNLTTIDTYRNFITEANQHKDIPIYGEDYFSGLPINELSFLQRDEEGNPIKNSDGEYQYDNYIIPYFDPTKYDDNEPYDGDLFFQQNGGWDKMIEEGEHEWDLADANEYQEWLNSNNGNKGDYYPKELLSHIDYKETLSYLHIVSNVSDLLNVNSREINEGDIYYVVNLNDFMDYYEAEDNTTFNYSAITHFFMFRYGCYDTSVFSSWMNVSLSKGINEYDENIAKKAQYLDDLLTTTFGNNPHSGYGQYDCGVDFLEYLQKPFKYSLDNYDIVGVNDDGVLYSTIADNIKFTINVPYRTSDEDNDKLQIITQYEEGTVDPITIQKETDDFRKRTQFINSKVLVMENMVKGDKNYLYREYFLNVILPYVMQVIPSTTILVLKGYNLPYKDSGSVTESYSDITATLEYLNIPSDGDADCVKTIETDGETEIDCNECILEPLIQYSQTIYDADGKEIGFITDGATLTYEFTNTYGNTLSISENGVVNYCGIGKNETIETKVIADVKVTISLNEHNTIVEATILQVGEDSVYTTPIVELSYPLYPYDASHTIYPTLSYSQTCFHSDGRETTITSGAAVKYSFSGVSGTTIDENSGEFTYQRKNNQSYNVQIGTVTAEVSLNGKIGYGEYLVYQEATQIEENFYIKTFEFNNGKNIPAQSVEEYTADVVCVYEQLTNGEITLYEENPDGYSKNLDISDNDNKIASVVDRQLCILAFEENHTNEERFVCNAILTVNYYSPLDGSLLTAVSTIPIRQDAESEVVTYTEQIVVDEFIYNNDNIIPKEGGTYLAQLEILYQKINNNTGELVAQYVVTPSATTYSIVNNLEDLLASLDENDGTIKVNNNIYEADREATVKVSAEYLTSDGKTLNASREYIIEQEKGEISYDLIVETFSYNNGDMIPASGGTFSPTLITVLATTINGETTTEEVTIPEANCAFQCNGEVKELHTYTGEITFDENTTSSSKTVIVYFDGSYTAPNSEILVVSAQTTIIQEGESVTYTYDTPIISLTYGDVASSGGNASPTLSFTQKWTGSDGSSGEESDTWHPFSGSSYGSASFSKSDIGTFTTSINSNTGIVTKEENHNYDDDMPICTVTVQYTRNNKTTTATVDVYQLPLEKEWTVVNNAKMDGSNVDLTNLQLFTYNTRGRNIAMEQPTLAYGASGSIYIVGTPSEIDYTRSCAMINNRTQALTSATIENYTITLLEFS